MATADELKSLLVIDDQTDCACEIEKYETEYCKYIYLDGNDIKSKMTNYCGHIHLPISNNKIEYNQIKNVFLEAFKFALKINVDEIYEYEKIIINTKFDFDKLTKDWQELIYKFMSKCFSKIIKFDEIEDDKIYFIKPAGLTGVFTFNLRGDGLFIMPEQIAVAAF